MLLKKQALLTAALSQVVNYYETHLSEWSFCHEMEIHGKRQEDAVKKLLAVSRKSSVRQVFIEKALKNGEFDANGTLVHQP